MAIQNMEYLNSLLKRLGKPVSDYKFRLLAATGLSLVAGGLLLYMAQRQASQVFGLAFMIFGLLWLISTLWGKEEKIEAFPWLIRCWFILIFSFTLPLAIVFLFLAMARFIDSL